ncbi:MAG TPA: CxxxxCH/CxxCH domain-containing protein [Anaeromyxobacter sp.]|nr:CxxxxCH/CxxCH domain-containing protein [Anaeromyxobacter sp.]
MRRSLAPFSLALVATALLLVACGDARRVSGEPGASAACAACHGDAASAASLGGAHAVHLATTAVAEPVACGDCHAVPPSIDAPGHQDGRVDVTFGERAGGKAARWNAEAGTCAVYCHGASLAGGPSASPAWRAEGAGPLSCGACHGAPPPAPHPADADCATCHAATVGEAGGVRPGGAHGNGRIDPPPGDAACGSCHAIPPPAPHVASTSCGSCHAGYTQTSVNPAVHRNGAVDVASAEAACGSCHGVPPPAPHVASTSCGSCHAGYTQTSVNAAVHRNGRVDVAPAEAACGSCHAIPPPAPHAASTSCGSCHAGYTQTSVNAAVHRNGRVDVSAQACGSCHAIPPSSGEHRKHVFEERVSCGSCHPGASPTSGGSGHANGAVDVASSGWNPARVSCANACHDGDEERWFD